MRNYIVERIGFRLENAAIMTVVASVQSGCQEIRKSPLIRGRKVVFGVVCPHYYIGSAFD